MRRLSITPGEKRNRLTLVREVEPDEKRNALVECRCECGETTVVRFHSFINGIVQSCGCLVRDGREHITLEPGARSGRLTFLRELPKSDNKRWIEVRCDCGAITKRGARMCSGCRKPFCSRCRVRLAALKGYCNHCVPHLPRRGDTERR